MGYEWATPGYSSKANTLGEQFESVGSEVSMEHPGKMSSQ